MVQLELFPPPFDPVTPELQTFADVIERISQSEALNAIQKRYLEHALKRVSDGLNLPCHEVRTASGWLGPQLAKLSAKSMGIQEKTLANLLSYVRIALTLYTPARARTVATLELNAFWQALWNQILASESKTLVCALSGPVIYFSRRGLAPSDVALEHFQAWKVEMTETFARKDPDHAYKKAVRAWNQAAASIENWPKAHVCLPEDPRRITLPLDHFPATFGEDLARYLSHLQNPNRLLTKTPQMGFATTTIDQYRALLRRFASILVRAGVDPAKITSLTAIIDPAMTEIGLKWMLSRAGDALTDQISDMASLIKRVGMNYVNVSAADQIKLNVFNKNLAVPQRRGLSERNELRLLPLRDKDVLTQLHRLPRILFERSLKNPGMIESATLREDAILIGLELRVPLRRKNLLSIHLKRTF